MDLIAPPRGKKRQSKIASKLNPEPPKRIPVDDPKINPHDIDIFVKQNSSTRGNPENPEDFKLYCTGSVDLMLHGIDIKLDLEMNREQCRAYIFDQIKSRGLLDEYEENLYFHIIYNINSLFRLEHRD